MFDRAVHEAFSVAGGVVWIDDGAWYERSGAYAAFRLAGAFEGRSDGDRIRRRCVARVGKYGGNDERVTERQLRTEEVADRVYRYTRWGALVSQLTERSNAIIFFLS